MHLFTCMLDRLNFVRPLQFIINKIIVVKFNVIKSDFPLKIGKYSIRIKLKPREQNSYTNNAKISFTNFS